MCTLFSFLLGNYEKNVELSQQIKLKMDQFKKHQLFAIIFENISLSCSFYVPSLFDVFVYFWFVIYYMYI